MRLIRSEVFRCARFSVAIVHVISCHLPSIFARRRMFEVRGNPYVWGESSNMYDEHGRQLKTGVAAVAVGRNF